MSEPLWAVEVGLSDPVWKLWFTLTELAKAKLPALPDGTLLRVADYKRELHCFEDPRGCQPIVLQGAWIHEPGRLVCDGVKRD